MTKNSVYKTNVCELFWDERGFVRLNLLETQNKFDLNEAKKQFKIALNLSDNRPCRVLIDARGSNALPDKEAQDFTSNAPMRIAEAIIVDSLSMRILSKFYMKKNKKNTVRIFSREKNAIDWLMSFGTDDN